MEDYAFDILSVGQCYEQFASNLDVMTRIHFRETFWQLDIGMRHITPAEVHEIQYGDLSIAFSEINYCLFILFKFGTLSWADAPYEPRLHKRKFDFYEFKPGSGIPLNICISDTSNGLLVAMRSMGLGTTFSNGLHMACRELQEQPFSESSFDWMIKKTYNRYKTSDAMLKTVQPGNVWIFTKENGIK